MRPAAFGWHETVASPFWFPVSEQDASPANAPDSFSYLFAFNVLAHRWRQRHARDDVAGGRVRDGERINFVSVRTHKPAFKIGAPDHVRGCAFCKWLLAETDSQQRCASADSWRAFVAVNEAVGATDFPSCSFRSAKSVLATCNQSCGLPRTPNKAPKNPLHQRRFCVPLEHHLRTLRHDIASFPGHRSVPRRPTKANELVCVSDVCGP